MKYVPAKASIAALLLFAPIHKIKRFFTTITTVGMKKSSAKEAMRNSRLQGQLPLIHFFLVGHLSTTNVALLKLELRTVFDKTLWRCGNGSRNLFE